MNSFHWLRAFLILVATCIVVVAMSSSAWAGDCCDEGMHGKHANHSMPAWSDLDANGDETVTAEEFYAFRAERMASRAAEGRKMKHAQHAPAFEDLDLDGDGSLSAEEFAKHRAQCPMRNRRKAENAE